MPNGNHFDPASYARRVLLAVSGLTPQVLTETIFALATNSKHPWTPTEVYLLTTTEGARIARLRLLSEDPGWFYKMTAELGLEEITFPPENIEVMRLADGTALEDIRTAEENEAAADAITAKIRELTADVESALHVSLAGGRKTMGFFAGYALSLYGREQDRLSHVLVPADYEGAEDFYYPSRTERVITGRGGKTLDASDARLMLAEIPFVRLRQGLPEELQRGRASYSEVISAANAILAPAELIIDQKSLRVKAAGKIFSMQRMGLAMLSVFARRALKGGGTLGAPAKGVHDEKWSRLLFEELRRTVEHPNDLSSSTLKTLRSQFDGEYFSVQITRMRRQLKQALGVAAKPYLVDDGGVRPHRYSLTVRPEAIRFDELPSPPIDS